MAVFFPYDRGGEGWGDVGGGGWARPPVAELIGWLCHKAIKWNWLTPCIQTRHAMGMATWWKIDEFETNDSRKVCRVKLFFASSSNQNLTACNLCAWRSYTRNGNPTLRCTKHTHWSLPMHLPPAQVYNPKAGCFFRRRLIDTCGEFGLSISIICKARNNVRGISMQVRALDARILTIPGKRNQAKTSHRVNSLW